MIRIILKENATDLAEQNLAISFSLTFKLSP